MQKSQKLLDDFHKSQEVKLENNKMVKEQKVRKVKSKIDQLTIDQEEKMKKLMHNIDGKCNILNQNDKIIED